MNRLVIAASKLCLGCYTCEAACVDAHQKVGLQAHPRLVVTHTPQGSMPVQCRHCEEAPCAKVCPVGAITQAAGTIQLDERTCIGCKMCALVCPVGAIEAHGSSPLSQQLPFDSSAVPPGVVLSEPLAPRENLPPSSSLLEWCVGVRTVAVKCDLCYFREEGPKCVEVCPTKALRLVESEALAALISGKRSQAVVDMTQLM